MLRVIEERPSCREGAAGMDERGRAGAVPWRRGRGRGRRRALTTAALLLAVLALLACVAPVLPLELSWGLGLMLLLCR